MNEWSNGEGPAALQLLSVVASCRESGDVFGEESGKTNGNDMVVDEWKDRGETRGSDVEQTRTRDEDGRSDASSHSDHYPGIDSAHLDQHPGINSESNHEDGERGREDKLIDQDGTDSTSCANAGVNDSEYEIETTVSCTLNGNAGDNGSSTSEITPSEVNVSKSKQLMNAKSKRNGPLPTMWRHLRLKKGHHELVEVLVRAEFGSVDMRALQRCITKYTEQGWTSKHLLASTNDIYKFPLLHWAAVLGRFKAVKFLLERGFSCLDQAEDTGGTALHAATLHLVAARRKVAPAKYIFERLVGLLRESLIIQDNEMASPMHRAAEQLALGVHADHYEHCLIMMLVQAVNEFGTASLVTDLQNQDGNTVLHILCKHDAVAYRSIKAFLEAGADPNILNNAGMMPADLATHSGAERNASLLLTTHSLTGSVRSAAALASAVNAAQQSPTPTTQQSPTTDTPPPDKEDSDALVAASNKTAGSQRRKDTKTAARRRQPSHSISPSKQTPASNEKTGASKKKTALAQSTPIYRRKTLRQQAASKSSRLSKVPDSSSPLDIPDLIESFCETPTAEPVSKRKTKSVPIPRNIASRTTRHANSSTQPTVSATGVKRKAEPLPLATSKRSKLQPTKPKPSRVDQTVKTSSTRRKRKSSRKASAETFETASSFGEKQQEEEANENASYSAYMFPSSEEGMMEVSYEPKQEDESGSLASGTEIYCNPAPDGGQTYSLKAAHTPLNSPYFHQARHNLDAILGRLTRKSEVSDAAFRSSSVAQSLSTDDSLVESLMATGLMDQLPELAKKTKAETETSLTTITKDIEIVDEELQDACRKVESKCKEIEALTDQAEILMRELDELRGIEDGVREKKREAEERLQLAKVRMAHCDRIAEEAPLLQKTLPACKTEDGSHADSTDAM